MSLIIRLLLLVWRQYWISRISNSADQSVNWEKAYLELSAGAAVVTSATRRKLIVKKRFSLTTWQKGST